MCMQLQPCSVRLVPFHSLDLSSVLFREIVTTAKTQLGLMYSHFYHECRPDTQKALYITIVRPLLEYAVPIWDPRIVKDIVAPESVHRFATKSCTRAWQGVDYSERLCMLNQPTLKARYHTLKLCYLYKILNGLAFAPTSPVSFINPQRHLAIPFCSLRGMLPFILLWKSSFLKKNLPDKLVQASSFMSFMQAYLSYFNSYTV